MTVTEQLLLIVFRHRIREPDLETGISRLAETAGGSVTPDEWRAAVAQAVAAGTVHDPVRLPPGALQCHWHLELTAAGVAAARALADGSVGPFHWRLSREKVAPGPACDRTGNGQQAQAEQNPMQPLDTPIG